MQKLVSIEEIVSRLEGKGCTVKKTGDVYRSQCPAHDGEDLNLAFTEGKKGRVVFTCHSHNCGYDKIMEALGLEKEMPVEMRTPIKKSMFGKKIHRTFEDAVAAYACGDQPKERPDKIYRYVNEDGGENVFILRWDRAGGKRIRPVTKVDGGYICGESTDGDLPIYNLPKIAGHVRTATGNVRIIVTEGEKAADTATSLGFVATTSAFGSKSAHKADWAALDRLALRYGKKFELILLPDNDEPGRKYAETLVGIFSKFKSQPIIKIVSIRDFKDTTGLAEFPKGGDLFDLCELLDSKTDEEIRGIVENMIGETVPEIEIVEDDEPNCVYPWHPFPVDLLPETAARFVHEVAAANCCDPAGVAVAALVALAAAIGNSRRLRLKRGWVFPAILWGMLIARKGSIKSWAMAPAIKPLDRRQEEYHEQYSRDKANYDRKKAEYMTLSPKQRREVPPFDLKEPVMRRIVSREATEQKLVKNCAENHRGLCLFTDELATLLKGMGQYCKDGKGGNAQSMFNSLFNGEGLESERIGESRYAPHAFVCILGGIQPGMARKCFDQEAFESGFASRFIPVAPPLRVAKWSDAVIDEETEQNYFQLIFDILGLEMEQIYGPAHVEVSEWSPEENAIIAVNGVPTEPTGVRPILIETAPEALAVFKEFYDRTAEEMLTLEDDNIRGTFEKLRTYAARLALVIHITRFMEQEMFLKRNIDPEIAPWDRSTPRIDELECDAESMRIAVALADWFKYEVRRVYSTWGGLADETPTPKGDPLQQRIVEFMEQKHEPVTVSELKRRFKSDKTNILQAVEQLVDRNILQAQESEKSGPGRRSESYRLAK